jgi:hypothetical protein
VAVPCCDNSVTMKTGVMPITSPLRVSLLLPNRAGSDAGDAELRLRGHLRMMIAMLNAPRFRAGRWCVCDLLHAVHLPAEISISMKSALARMSDLKLDKGSIRICSSTFLGKHSQGC